MIDLWYERYRAELLRYIRRLTSGHADSEDILSTIFMEALIRPPADICPRAWLYQTARWRIIDWRRQQRRRECEELGDVARDTHFEETVLMRIQLDQEWRRLTDGQRVALWGYCVEDRPIKQLAHRLGCSPWAVKARVHRARVTLRETI